MKDKVIGIYCLIDDLLKTIGHTEDQRRRISDSEVLTTAIVSAMLFSGHQEHSINFMKATGLIPEMLEKSRFCRRLHKLGTLLYELFVKVGMYLKEICCELEYILDSFPVAVCDNIRIERSKLLRGKKWRGYTASLRRYFYGVKVQLLVTQSGIPVEFCFVPGKQADVKAMERILANLPAESKVYADSGYNDYKLEDSFKENKLVELRIQRKCNAKRKDTIEQAKEKLKKRKRVETAISDIKKLFPRTIHAVTLNGFLMKLMLFIFAAQLLKITN